jgi:hypothetical protein
MSSPKGVFYSEEELLQIRLKRSYKERLDILLELIRINKELSGSKIIHPAQK